MSEFKRREFLGAIAKSAGVLVGASMLDISLLRSVAVAQESGVITVKLVEHEELQAVGGAIVLEVAAVADVGGKIILARTGDATFVAIAAKCTHKGCTIEYDGDEKRFECPCHGSRYNLDGTVQRGPAPRALHSYKTAFADGTVTITLAA